MPDQDYYDILGVSREADLPTIKQAYRRAALKYHPDKNPGDAQAEQRFKEAAVAYAVLSDPDKRRTYDRFGKAGLGAQAGAGFSQDIFTDFSDILGDLFGLGSVFGGGRRRSRRPVGRDLRFDLELDFEEAVAGLETQIQVPRLDLCPTCDGHGAAPGGMRDCDECGGRGQVAFQQGFFTIARACGHCQGSGKEITEPCGECEGSGRLRSERTLQVRIPPGVDDGIRLRIGGEGEAVAGGTPGDLYVVLHVRTHPFFHRQENDIICEVPISFAQATLGTEVTVPTVDGEQQVRVAAGTQAGTTVRLRGRGVPEIGGRGRGDQVIVWSVRTPIRLSDEQRKLFEQLAELEGEDTGGSGLFDRVKNIFGN